MKKSRVIKENMPYLLELQFRLRQLLFVRPFDIQKIESAAINICDAIILTKEGELLREYSRFRELLSAGS